MHVVKKKKKKRKLNSATLWKTILPPPPGPNPFPPWRFCKFYILSRKVLYIYKCVWVCIMHMLSVYICVYTDAQIYFLKWVHYTEALCVLIAQLYPTLWDPVDYSPPGSPVHGILQARLLEWVAILFSRGSFWPRDWTLYCWSPVLQTDSLASEPPEKPKHRSSFF